MGSNECHLMTPGLRRYNFCGPNTRLNDRLNVDGTPQNWSTPINRIDAICMRHDIAYGNADGTRSDADLTMLQELNELKNEDLTCNELLAKYFTMCIIGIVYRFRAIVKRCRSRK